MRWIPFVALLFVVSVQAQSPTTSWDALKFLDGNVGSQDARRGFRARRFRKLTHSGKN